MSRQGLAKRPATYDDLVKVPDHLIAEILEGDLYATPCPSAPHALAASALGGELVGPFPSGRGGPGGWWILDEPELHLGADVVVPDLAGWHRSTLPQIPYAPAISVAPDWVCEILSLSTEAMDRVPKLAIYARERVSHVCFVNPRSLTLEVLRFANGHWIVAATQTGQPTHLQSLGQIAPVPATARHGSHAGAQPPREPRRSVISSPLQPK